MRSTRRRSSRNRRRGIMPATWRCAAPPIKTCRWCWRARRRRWKAGTGPSGANIQLVADAAPRAELAAAGRADDRSARRSAQQVLARRDQPAAAPGDGRGAARRRAGDSAAQPPRAFDAHSMPGVRSCAALPALRLGADVSPARQHGRLPLLRLPLRGANGVPGMQVRRHALQRLGHAEARSRSAGAVSRLSRACGWTPTACAPAAATSRRWPRFATATCEFCSARR